MSEEKSSQINIPDLQLPKGGGAIQGLNDAFEVNKFTGAATFSIPLPMPEARALTPGLGLTYNSSAGNGILGMGFSLGIPAIGRNTNLGIPAYQGDDIFTLSGSGTLVPKLGADGEAESHLENKDGEVYRVTQYIPDIEEEFKLIHHWENINAKDSYWVVVNADNTRNLFGMHPSARISDPSDAAKIFQWNLQETSDAKGNKVVYKYRQDCSQDPSRPWVNTYISSIEYGNYKDAGQETYAFEIFFSYNENPGDVYSFSGEKEENWSVRADAFSSFKSGFEIRTERRCQRICIFHKFKGRFNDQKVLTWVVDLTYVDNDTLDSGQVIPVSLLTKITKTGYRLNEKTGERESKALPPIELDYTTFQLSLHSPFRPIEAPYPFSVPGNFTEFQLVDLHREGLPGILYSNPGGHLYWEPEGEGSFSFPRSTAEFPIDRDLEDPSYILMDIDGNGGLELVVHDEKRQGYYSYDAWSRAWKNFTPFSKRLTGAVESDYSVVDLNGDGCQDIMISNSDLFTVFFSEGTKGYKSPVYVNGNKSLPILTSNSEEELVTFADIFGDGLMHCVRIRNGSVECWPNHGNGRFGQKITIDNAPWFGEEFDPKKIFLTDVDGSGTADIAYLSEGKVAVYINKNGNGYADPFYISLPGSFSELDQVKFADILGSGFNSLVFTKMVGEVKHYYYDFLEGVQPGKISTKPYLLRCITNNLGSAKTISYCSSTRYYLDDKKKGRPWATVLPFPVQIVEKVVYSDLISGWSSAEQFAYHEGYYDPIERQFRGFGFIETWNGEETGANNTLCDYIAAPRGDYEKYLYAPVAYTKSWYLIGDYKHQPKIADRFREQYFKGDKDAYVMPDSILSEEINRFDEYTVEHAYQALNGKLIHEEVYGLDEKSHTPYTVTESNYLVKQIQPRGKNRYPVMQVVSRESITYNYERKADDPGAVHTFNLVTDEYGHTLLNSHVFYPRRPEHYRYPGQTELKLTADTTLYNEPCPDGYVLGVVCETRSFEIRGASPAGQYFTFSEMKTQTEEALSNKQGLSSILTGWQRNYFWNADQTNCLPLKQITARALMHHQRQAVFAKDYIMNITINGKSVVNEDDLINEAGYILDEEYFWNPGMIGYYYKEEDDKYFLPFQTDNYRERTSGADSLNKRSKVYYDEYLLKMIKRINFLEEDEASPHNHITLTEIDYIFLKEKQITDINGNLSQVLFDTLGQVIVTTQFKPGIQSGTIQEGDMPVSGYDISVLENADFMKVINDPKSYLQRSSTFFYYDANAWYREKKPVSSIKLARDKYVMQDPSGNDTNIFVEVNYSDGFGRNLETKVLTRSGLSMHIENDPAVPGRSSLVQAPGDRWIVSGKTIYNNKGKEALLYQSYFSPTPLYEEQGDLSAFLPPPVCNLYDALDRVIREDSPKAVVGEEVKGFFSATEREAWQIITYDKNDTVTGSSYYHWFMSTYPVNPTPQQENEKDALEKASLCENTPSKEIFDVKGNTVLKVVNNLGKVSETKIKEKVSSLPGQVQQEIWELFKTNYLDVNDFLCPDFRPYDPSFSINIPPPLEPYKDSVLIVQDYLSAGCMTSFYEVDIQGRTRKYIDARLYYDNVRHNTDYYSNKYLYDLTSKDAIYTDSPDSGQRLGLTNMFGNLFKAWDARGFVTHSTFDRLERMLSKHVSGTEEMPPGKVIPSWKPLVLDNTVEMVQYGEISPEAKKKNLFGQVAVYKDQAGVLTNTEFTLNAKPVSIDKILLKDYKQEVNWLNDPALEDEVYTKSYSYSVQGAVFVEVDLLDGNRVFEKSNQYNVSGALTSVQQTTYMQGNANPVIQTVITDIDYYPNRQPVSIWYGNGTRSVYSYEFTTQRMTCIDSFRSSAGENAVLQSIQYTYDPVGNITRTTDDSFEAVHCYGQEVKPLRSYHYDCLYQLLTAGGRQHIGVNGNSYKNGFKESAYFKFCPPPIGDTSKLVNYTENYQYDFSGNLLKLQHITHNPAGENWTRNNEVQQNNNHVQQYPYDRNGNQLCLYENSGTPLSWDYRNLLASATKLERVDYVNDQEYYVYNSAGMRMRKVTERVENGNVSTEEIIYLDGWEIKRVKRGAGINLERYTRHILAEKKQAAIVYYWLTDSSNRETVNGQQLQTRYQLADLQSSVALEMDDQGARITYEEYFPYGGSAFMSGTSEAEVKLKYYRFTGKECDDTTGLCYFGARYYAPWIGRWISTDPQEQFASPYTYSYNNPTTATDPDGQWAWLIPIVVGGLISAYTGYKAGKDQGASGAKLAVYTIGGGTIGAVSGGAGGYIASASIPFAQTVSMVVTSTVSSKAMSYITGGNTTTSFGGGSIDWSTKEVNYLFKGGVRNGSNSLGENVGYAFGLMANISDIRAGFSGTTVQLVTESDSTHGFDHIGHSALVNPAEGINVSVGPVRGYYPPLTSPKAFVGGLFEVINGRSWNNYYGDPHGYAMPIYNVNKNVLKEITRYISANQFTSALPYSGLGYSCVDYTSKALWQAGVVHFYPPIHPYLLPVQMMARQTGIYANPYLVTSRTNQQQHAHND